ncbi:MAG: beta-L-arabinofuranosidase domain-containing protein [Sedimentisphaeraceae bacterium JB056]
MKYSLLKEVDIKSVAPKGWLRRYLINQKHGLTGNLEVAGFPFDTKGWAGPLVKAETGHMWWPYEQYSYWIDGMLKCGYLLNDNELVERARKQISYVFKRVKKDGWLGPKALQKTNSDNLWPYAIFLRAVLVEYSATGNENIIKMMRRHFASREINISELREICNIEPMAYVHSLSGDKKLLKEIEGKYEAYNAQSDDDVCDPCVIFNHHILQRNLLSDQKPGVHGVTYNEIGKLGAIIYMCNGDKKALETAVNAYKKIDKYNLMVDGVCSSSELMSDKDPLDTHETCDIADYTWGLGYLLMATGEMSYADRIEKACFNAAPGAVTNDFKALQYFSGPNQVICDKQSNHNEFFFGNSSMSYRPNPFTECCPGAVHRIMPNYVSRMWMKDGDDGITAVLYGPSEITASVGKSGKSVKITEDTNYPFSEDINFIVECEESVEFDFGFRIPSWTRRASLFVNGKKVKGLKLKAGKLCKLSRVFNSNDIVTLRLPMKLKVTKWPKGGVAVERGPIVYSLPIEADKRVDRADKKSNSDFPAWNMTPKGDWNYALAVNSKNIEQKVEVVLNGAAGYPWDAEQPPVSLKVPARKVKGWKIKKLKNPKIRYILSNGTEYHCEDMKGVYSVTPDLPDGEKLQSKLSAKEETITLVPYGCTELRMTIFPSAKD